MEKQRTTIAAMPPSRFGGWTPSQDPRVLFSLRRLGLQLFFLNHSVQVLEKVTNASIGVVSMDDEGGAAPTSEFKTCYELLQPGEAVLIDEFDDYFDVDSVIHTTIEVQCHGTTETFHASGKGGPGTKILKKMA